MPKTLALGTLLSIENDDATPIYVNVGNLTSLSVPGPTKNEVDTTDFDSVAKEFLATLPDNGSLDFSGFYNHGDVGQELAYTDANDPDAVARAMRIDFVNQDVRFSFSGLIMSFVPSAGGPETPYTFTGTIRVSGAVTKVTPIPA